MQLNPGMSAVLTGGASGLGAATARRLASHGIKVAIFDMSPAMGEELADEIGGVFCRVDVRCEEDVDDAFVRARSVHGQERILVNCAGIANAVKTASRNHTTGLITHFPLVDFDRVVGVNLVGTFRCIAKAAAGMLSLEPLPGGERGAIVNTASIAAQDGQIGQAAYAASKAGVVGMTLPIARDLMGAGIRVNTILPGFFDTPLLKSAPAPVRQALEASVPFPKRLGDPAEYAQLVEFLLSNAYMNGECIRLDGAVRMGPR